MSSREYFSPNKVLPPVDEEEEKRLPVALSFKGEREDDGCLLMLENKETPAVVGCAAGVALRKMV